MVLEAGQMAWKLGQLFARACVAAVALAAATLAAAAQETSTNRVGAHVAWSVFEETSPKECFSASQTSKPPVNTRDGRVVAVRRGPIRLFVFFRPAETKAPNVTFTGGYPFAPNSTVALEIGDDKFALVTQGEWAWPETPDADAKIIAAMKRGKEAILTARSARGTQTKDTFSLLGFTAALEDARKRCA